MSIGLSSAEYALLGELTTGARAISEARRRDRADRLVAAGYARSRNLNRRSVEYEVTDLGKSAGGQPQPLMSIGTAAILMDHLRAVGTDDLADDLKCKIEQAKRYAGMKTNA